VADLVLVDPGRGEGIDGLAHVLDAWLADWRGQEGHEAVAPCGALQTVGTDDLDAAGLADVMAGTLPPRAVRTAPLDVMGPLGQGVPVGMLIVRVGAWSAEDHRQLARLQTALAPSPLLAIALGRPVRDLEALAASLLARMSPHTPTRVLAPRPSDPASLLLAAELGALAVELGDRGAFEAGCMGRPLLQTVSGTLDANHWHDSLALARTRWLHSVAWHDSRYLHRLDRWLRGALEGESRGRIRLALIHSVAVQLARHLRDARDPCEPMHLELCMEGLHQLPPLPSRRIASLTLHLANAEGVNLALGQLPPDLERLSVRGGRLDQHTLDQLEASGHGIRIETPASLFDRPGRLRHALQGWIDLLPGEANHPDWQAVEDRLGDPDFVGWIARLARLRPHQRRAIRPQLVALIERCMSDPLLCESVLATVQGADARCDDRVVLVWERVRLTLAATQASELAGTPSAPAAALIEPARRAFRTEKLLAISAAKTREVEAALIAEGREPQDVEEVEIDLAYLSQLDSLLDLGSGMGFALHIDERVSHVSLREVMQAARQVRRAENAHFPRFLTEWSPWCLLLQQRRPQAYQAIQVQRQDLELIETWTAELQQAMDQVDGQAANGSPLSTRERQQALTRGLVERERAWVAERLLALTREVLQEEGAADRLEPVWS
jgi:hypothetical protein